MFSRQLAARIEGHHLRQKIRPSMKLSLLIFTYTLYRNLPRIYSYTPSTLSIFSSHIPHLAPQSIIPQCGTTTTTSTKWSESWMDIFIWSRQSVVLRWVTVKRVAKSALRLSPGASDIPKFRCPSLISVSAVRISSVERRYS
jgi:hypothetical protein